MYVRNFVNQPKYFLRFIFRSQISREISSFSSFFNASYMKRKGKFKAKFIITASLHWNFSSFLDASPSKRFIVNDCNLHHKRHSMNWWHTGSLTHKKNIRKKRGDTAQISKKISTSLMYNKQQESKRERQFLIQLTRQKSRNISILYPRLVYNNFTSSCMLSFAFTIGGKKHQHRKRVQYTWKKKKK